MARTDGADEQNMVATADRLVSVPSTVGAAGTQPGALSPNVFTAIRTLGVDQ
jgi:hypothetical protein